MARCGSLISPPLCSRDGQPWKVNTVKFFRMKEVFQICDACIIYMDQYNMYKYEVIQHATWSYIIIMITCLLHIYDTPVLSACMGWFWCTFRYMHITLTYLAKYLLTHLYCMGWFWCTFRYILYITQRNFYGNFWGFASYSWPACRRIFYVWQVFA